MSKFNVLIRVAALNTAFQVVDYGLVHSGLAPNSQLGAFFALAVPVIAILTYYCMPTEGRRA